MQRTKMLALCGVATFLALLGAGGVYAWRVHSSASLIPEVPCVPAQRWPLMANHMLSRQLADGLFSYEYDFVKNRFSAHNNVVRQAGAVYGLSDALLVTKDPTMAKSLLRAMAAFEGHMIPVGDGGLLPRSFDKDSPVAAKSGAGALLLLGVLNTEHAVGKTPLTARLREGLLRGLLAQQNATGGFAETLDPTRKEDPYANGEVWFALATYEDFRPGDPRVQKALALAEPYFMTIYPRRSGKEFFHWGALAASARYRTTHNPVYAQFLNGHVETFLAGMKPVAEETSPYSFLVEGLAAAAPWLTDKALQARVLERVKIENDRTCSYQIMPGQTHIRMGQNGKLGSKAFAGYAGGVMNGGKGAKIRIDYTQHALSSFLRTQEMEVAMGLASATVVPQASVTVPVMPSSTVVAPEAPSTAPQQSPRGEPETDGE